jgi:decaprenylphospho-beta-D-erythro-pentofuranosid-2-ulose 2-reductase
MTQHLVDQGQRLASADSVAAAIVRGIERGKPVVYAPGKWRLIMAVVRAIPSPIFRRLSL